MALATGLSAVAAPALAIAPPKDITLQQDFDELWETIRDRYAYFEEKATDWDRVRAIYLPRLAEVGDDEDKWMRLLGFDHRRALRCPYPLRSRRAGPSALAAVRHFGRRFAGGSPGTRPARRIRCSGCRHRGRRSRHRDRRNAFCAGGRTTDARALRRPDPEARWYAINAAVGGNRERDRKLRIRSRGGQVRDLVLPYKAAPNRPAISHRRLDSGFGYIAITTFGDNDTPKAFDAALLDLKDSRGLIIDVRENGGGDTAVARPIMGRFIRERRPYALMRRRSGQGVA
jgi:carboxyl-terminal processing protease